MELLRVLMLRGAVVQRGVIVPLGIGYCTADLDRVQLVGADPPISEFLATFVCVEVPLRSSLPQRYRSRPILGTYVEEGSSIGSAGKLMRRVILGGKGILFVLVGDRIAGGNQVL